MRPVDTMVSGGPGLIFLLSFDIDGTMEIGDPPGGITMDMVRRAQECGCLIGSSSDRPLSVQQSIWDKHDIQADFISGKHMLIDVKVRLNAGRYIHIGDTELDRQLAAQAGFDFLWEHEAVSEPWLT